MEAVAVCLPEFSQAFLKMEFHVSSFVTLAPDTYEKVCNANNRFLFIHFLQVTEFAETEVENRDNVFRTQQCLICGLFDQLLVMANYTVLFENAK